MLRVVKTIALVRKVRHRGIEKVGWLFTFAADTSTYALQTQFGSGLSFIRHNAGYRFFENLPFFRSLLV